MAPLRQALADSNVGAIAVVVLLISFLDAAFRAIWPILSDVVTYLATAVAILGVPYFSFPSLNRFVLISTVTNLYGAPASLGAAWLLSRWISGAGPLCLVMKHGDRLRARNHA